MNKTCPKCKVLSLSGKSPEFLWCRNCGYSESEMKESIKCPICHGDGHKVPWREHARCDSCCTDFVYEKSEAQHFDSNKLRLDLIPPATLEYLAKAFGYGAGKYSDHNYLKGMPWSKLFGSTLRHLLAWFKGEDNDSESSLPHLAHALADIAMLIEIIKRHPKLDDRVFKETA